MFFLKSLFNLALPSSDANHRAVVIIENDPVGNTSMRSLPPLHSVQDGLDGGVSCHGLSRH